MNREDGFTKIPNRFVNYMKTMTEAEKDIYIYLRSWKNNYKDGYVEAAISTLMSNTGYTNRKTITTAILGLIEKGWIKDIIHQAGAGKREGKNKYLLNDEPQVNVELLKRERARRKAKKEQMIVALTNSIASDSVEIDSVASVTVLNKIIEKPEKKKRNTGTTSQTSEGSTSSSSKGKDKISSKESNKSSPPVNQFLLDLEEQRLAILKTNIVIPSSEGL